MLRYKYIDGRVATKTQYEDLTQIDKQFYTMESSDAAMSNSTVVLGVQSCSVSAVCC